MNTRLPGATRLVAVRIEALNKSSTSAYIDGEDKVLDKPTSLMTKMKGYC